MKKRIVTCIMACVMALLFAMPVMASNVSVVVPVNMENYEIISPHNEMTQIYLKNAGNGRIYMRVWSITNGRWITDWTFLGYL